MKPQTIIEEANEKVIKSLKRQIYQILIKEIPTNRELRKKIINEIFKL